MKDTYAYELLTKDKRIDGRKLLDYRKVELETNTINKAEGSAHVRFGNTRVLVGIKLNIGQPFPDTPDEGVLMCGAEFTPLASPDFESGPPSPEAIELARVVDRGIRESHMVELGKLKIDDEHVWMVNVDIHILSHDGNLMDAAALGAVAALKSTKIPKVDKEKMQVIRGDFEKDLPVVHTPINISICRSEGKTILDPTHEEEEIIDAKLSVAVREDDKLCALQKQGTEGIDMKDIEGIFDLAIKKSKELRKLVK